MSKQTHLRNAVQHEAASYSVNTEIAMKCIIFMQLLCM